MKRKKKVSISQSKDACADNFSSAQRCWHFVSGGGSDVSNSVAAAEHVLLLLVRLLPPPSPYVFLFVSPTLLLVSLGLSLLL